MKTRPSKSAAFAFFALGATLLSSLTALAQQACVLPTPTQQAALNPLIQEVIQPNPNGVPPSYGAVTLSNVPPGYSVGNGTYLGWCVNPNVGLTPGTVYYPIMYNTYDLAGLASIGVSTANNVWNKVNYIINHKPPGANASTIQAAIWRLTNFSAADEAALVAGTYGFGFPPADLATINAIVNDANANGAAFVPGPNNVIAIYLNLPIPPQTIPSQPFIIEVICPPVPTPSGPLTTYTMGGWGATPKGNNPGAFLAAYFAAIYPNGLKVGAASGFTLTFTSAHAIDTFLPCTGPAAPLKTSYTNPVTKLGVLAGQVVALRLAVDFSKAGVTPAGLANATFKSGLFTGRTVSYVLALAESVLGRGASLPAGIAYSDLSDACTLVNENYDGGLNNGELIP